MSQPSDPEDQEYTCAVYTSRQPHPARTMIHLKRNPRTTKRTTNATETHHQITLNALFAVSALQPFALSSIIMRSECGMQAAVFTGNVFSQKCMHFVSFSDMSKNFQHFRNFHIFDFVIEQL